METVHFHKPREKVDASARFYGKWVLKTNTNLSSEEVALEYKELWQVEQVFRDVKSVVEAMPIFHQRDEAIRGHVLDLRLEKAGHRFEWADIMYDLQLLQEVMIEDNGQMSSDQN